MTTEANDPKSQTKVTRSVTGIVSHWAETSSCHGISNIWQAKNLGWKTFWILVVLSGIGATVFQVVVLLMDYRTFPISVTLEVTFDGNTKFPAVTFCNVNRIRKSQLHLAGDVFEHILKATYNNTNWTNLEIGLDLEEIREEADREWIKLNETLKVRMGHQVEDMLIKCSFADKDCDYRNFHVINNPIYGNCFSFNFEAERARISHTPGPQAGLSLELYIEQHEYIAELTEKAGVRLSVHDQQTMPFPEDNGLLIAPNRHTTLALQKEVVSRLASPYHSKCWNLSLEESVNYDVYSEHYGVTYSLKGCQRSCYQREVAKKCKCGDPTMPLHGVAINISIPHGEILHPCSEEDEPCMEDVKALFTNGTLNCNCHVICEEMYLNFISSDADWPYDEYKTLYYPILESQGPGLATLIQSIASGTDPAKQLLKFEVFYQDLNYMHIKELRTYTPQTILSNIGGTTGLYLGISLAALFEFVELLGRVITMPLTRTTSVQDSKL